MANQLLCSIGHEIRREKNAGKGVHSPCKAANSLSDGHVANDQLSLLLARKSIVHKITLMAG